ncbi:MAG: hypothetical protein ACR2KK_10360 [Acidimicrobiales bacterium]
MTDEDLGSPGGTELDAVAAAVVERAFGVENRRRLLDSYFASHEAVMPANAWKHVYRLLLWVNPTIGLAHAYESDKCQPGKAWFPRSLAFHDWLSTEFGVANDELRDHLDRMFHAALPSLARVESDARLEAAVRHLAPYEGKAMPRPGEDKDLVDLVRGALSAFLTTDPSAAAWQILTERLFTHFGQENKRKNLLGRGFEDTLAAIVAKLPGADGWEIHTRVPISSVPSFNPQDSGEKLAEVDLAMWQKGSARPRRVVVTVKWSIRADRERQFGGDFADYAAYNSAQGGPFDHILVTNEFDAARLRWSCEQTSGHSWLFKHVVHVNPDGVLVAYGTKADPPPSPARLNNKGLPVRVDSSHHLRGFIADERLTSLDAWLARVLG